MSQLAKVHQKIFDVYVRRKYFYSFKLGHKTASVDYVPARQFCSVVVRSSLLCSERRHSVVIFLIGSDSLQGRLLSHFGNIVQNIFFKSKICHFSRVKG